MAGSKRKLSGGGGSSGTKKPKLKNKSVTSSKKSATTPAKTSVAQSANANWLALQAKLRQSPKPNGAAAAEKKEKKRDLDVAAHKQKARAAQQQQRRQQRAAEWVDNARVCAMDCEMVGVGLSGKASALARCSIVDFDGAVLYDKFVRPAEKVTGAALRAVALYGG